MANSLMLDTNVFNRVVDGDVPLSAFNGRQLFATSVQMKELLATADVVRRNDLLSVFQTLSPELKMTTAVWDDSEWDCARWPEEDGLFEKMLARLTDLDRRKKKRGKEFNLSRDVRIAEEAIRASLTLVTDDCNLATVTKEFRGIAIRSKDLMGL
jgi:predicted nucleic acid-binding protein